MGIFQQATNREGKPLEHLSYSSLKVFDQCPKKWWYEYVEKPDVVKNDELLIFGSYIHEKIENWLNGEHVETEDEQVNTSILATNKLIEDNGLETISVEEKVEATVADIPFVGYIDAIMIAGDEKVVVDHKTSKSYKTAENASYNVPQLQTYAKIVEVRRGILNYPLTQQYFIYDFTDQQIEDNWASLEKTAQQLITCVEAEPKKGSLCGWCDYKPLCPAFNKKQNK